MNSVLLLVLVILLQLHLNLGEINDIAVDHTLESSSSSSSIISRDYNLLGKLSGESEESRKLSLEYDMFTGETVKTFNGIAPKTSCPIGMYRDTSDRGPREDGCRKVSIDIELIILLYLFIIYTHIFIYHILIIYNDYVIVSKR